MKYSATMILLVVLLAPLPRAEAQQAATTNTAPVLTPPATLVASPMISWSPIAWKREITGLKQVEKTGLLAKRYHYLLDEGSEIVTDSAIKHIKDLRTYNEAHPVRNWIQKAAKRWESVAGLVCGGVVTYTQVAGYFGKH